MGNSGPLECLKQFKPPTDFLCKNNNWISAAETKKKNRKNYNYYYLTGKLREDN